MLGLVQRDPGIDKNGMFYLGLSARAKLTKRQAIVYVNLPAYHTQ
jgi:hypothetical protein